MDIGTVASDIEPQIAGEVAPDAQGQCRTEIADLGEHGIDVARRHVPSHRQAGVDDALYELDRDTGFDAERCRIGSVGILIGGECGLGGHSV